jgi:UDP-N-acetylglucosamine:LPS N-acetylglucosamine transferase
MKTTITILALVLAFGCKQQSTTSVSAPASDNNATVVSQSNLTPEQLGELGAKIKKNPNDAQKLLSEQGLTEQSFEQQIRRVAQDPEASKKYADAYKKAS